jgi:hypothetical protein
MTVNIISGLNLQSLTYRNSVGDSGAKADLCLPEGSGLILIQKISHPNQQAPVHLHHKQIRHPQTESLSMDDIYRIQVIYRY